MVIVVNCYKYLIRSHVSYTNSQGRRETMCFIRKHLKTNEGIENIPVIGNIVVVIQLLIKQFFNLLRLDKHMKSVGCFIEFISTRFA